MASEESNRKPGTGGNGRSAAEDRPRSLDVAELLLENDILGIVFLDAGGICRVFNRAAEALTGYGRDGILGKQIPMELFPEDVRDEIARSFISNGNLENRAIRLRRKDGGEREVILAMSSRIVRGGEKLGTALFFIDNSEKKHLQQLLLHSQRMEIVGEMAGGIAHDFNNLLEGILGYTSFMMNLLEEDHELMPYLEIIERSAKKASYLTDRLLTFSGGKGGEEVSARCNGLLREVVKLLERTIDKRIVIELNLDKNLKNVKGASGQLEQAFLNVCLNARDAMSEGGKLLVASENVVIDENFPRMSWNMRYGDYVRISISDTGVGMENGVKEKIFEPFFTTKKRDEGTGLGLNVVYGIVDSHGGFINVYSEVDKGTIFDIYLPACEEVREAEPVETKAPIRGGKEMVLIVDDEQIVRDLAQRMLQRLGYRTLTAADANEGKSVFNEHNDSIDLVILDMIMPGASGADMLETVTKIRPGTKVLLSSGYNRAFIGEELFEGENVGFIQKPYSIDDLAREVRGLLDGRDRQS